MATAQVSREPSIGFPTKGSLRRVSFPRLIREVARAKVDGSLYLLSGQTKKVVFFERGQPVFVRSNVLSECLGQILAQEGLITQEQCEQTLEAIRRTGKKQGELLVEMGILSEGNLRYGLEAQLRAKLFEIFSWEEGRYQFKNDSPGMQFGVTLKSSAEGVIVEAIQDQYTEERAAEALEEVSGKFPVVNPAAVVAAEPSLLPEERHFLACLDGSRSVRDLLQQAASPPVPTPKSLLYGLLAAGLIDLLDTAQPRKDWPAPPSLEAEGGSDDDLHPGYEAQRLITEYEDTPLPGEMPRSPGLLGDHEDDFAGVGEDSAVVRVADVVRTTEVAEELVAAESKSIDETFDDDQIELVEEGESESFAVGDEPSMPPLLGDGIDDDLNFEDEPPTSLEGPAVLTEPVAPVQPVAVAAPAMVAPAVVPSPEPPGPVAPALVVAPAPIEQEHEHDLMDLAPDDDLLMNDENVEAVAMDLLGAPAPAASHDEDDDDPLGDLSAPDDLGMDLPLETIDPVSLEPSFPNAQVPEAHEEDDDEDDEDDVLEVSPDELELADDDLEAEDDEDEGYEDEPQQAAPARVGGDDGLLGFDDLDDIDLGGEAAPDPYAAEESVGDSDMAGALRFNEGQSAVAEERWDEAVALLDEAYASGFDVAELHAMLAYARFQASGQDDQTAHHAFELLDYAQQMDPSLDLVHAYRGAILRAQGDIPAAREALDRALELNPYCELAMELLDAIG